jgi:hypothetical protein
MLCEIVINNPIFAQGKTMHPPGSDQKAINLVGKPR